MAVGVFFANHSAAQISTPVVHAGPLVAAPVKIVIRSGSAISWYPAATRFGINMRKQLGSILLQPAYMLSVAPSSVGFDIAYRFTAEQLTNYPCCRVTVV
jgi:hypothetical protein